MFGYLCSTEALPACVCTAANRQRYG